MVAPGSDHASRDRSRRLLEGRSMSWRARVASAVIASLLFSSVAAALPPASAPFIAPSVVTARDQQSLYLFTATSGSAPQYRVTTDATLGTWSAVAAAGDSSMRVTSANQCGNAGQECSRAHAFQFMETAVAGRWLYVTKS